MTSGLFGGDDYPYVFGTDLKVNFVTKMVKIYVQLGLSKMCRPKVAG